MYVLTNLPMTERDVGGDDSDTSGWTANVHVVATASLRGDDRSRWSPSSGSSGPELRSRRSRRDSYGVHTRSLGTELACNQKSISNLISDYICILRCFLIKRYWKISSALTMTWFCKNSRFALNSPAQRDQRRRKQGATLLTLAPRPNDC